ncbi:MAG: helix-turn-helix transcriptional regulator [Clostridia bacterium]|nr:helix-turn-helix transcriptional regulator [Clostridia bacterium]
MNSYSVRIKEIRKIRKLTQIDMGHLLGISNTMYCLYENEKRRMSINMLCQIADILETSTDYLLFRTNNPVQPKL